MPDDVVQDVRAHVETVVSAKTGELEERLSRLLSGCATETCVRAESDSVRVLLAGVETRFLEEYVALIEVVNEHTAATKAQTALLEALCGDVRAMNEKVDAFCSHTRVVWSTSSGTLHQSPSLFKALPKGGTLFLLSPRV